MSQATFKPIKHFQGSLQRSSLIVLLPLSLLPVFLMAALFTSYSYRLMREQITAQVSNIVESQANQLNEMVKANHNALKQMAADVSFSRLLNNLLEIGQGGTDFEKQRAQLLAEYERMSLTYSERPFTHFLVVSSDSTILISTKPEWEGFTFTNNQPLYPTLQEEQSVALINSKPLFEDDLILLSTVPYGNGVLIGIHEPSIALNAVKISSAIQREGISYLFTTDETLVGLHPNNQEWLILQPESGHLTSLIPFIHSESPVGVIEFSSYGTRDVVAFVSVIPEVQAALVIEVPQTVLFSAIYPLIPYIILILLGVSISVPVLIIIGVRRMVAPLLELSETTSRFAEGDWYLRSTVERTDEIGLLSHSFNSMADELTSLYRSLETKVEERTREIKTASEVAQIASSAHHLRELLQRTVSLIIERFGYYDASIILMDETGEYATLTVSAGIEGEKIEGQDYKFAIGSQSLIGWVTKNRQAYMAANVAEDPFYKQDGLPAETKSEIVVPITLGDRLLGVIDAQSMQIAGFTQEDVSVIQTLANQIAPAIYNNILLETTELNLEEASLVYNASRQIAKAETPGEIFQAVTFAIKQTVYKSIIYVNENGVFRGTSIFNPGAPNTTYPPDLLSAKAEEIQILLPTGNPLLIDNFTHPPKMPQALFNLLTAWKTEAAVLIPVLSRDELVSIIVLASPEKEGLSAASIQPFSNLAELTSTALEKVNALRKLEKQVNELEAYITVSQAVAGQIDLYTIYEVVHQTVTKSMGVVNFLVAIYDQENQTIQIPYMIENDKFIAVDPFPLGEGLTSILIRTGKPLLLVEDTERRSRELGAKILGAPSKSWLGVPLIVAGDIIGAIVVQDLEIEHKFDEDDMRLLNTMGSLIAAAIRNGLLLERSRQKAEQERNLHEITKKIRGATNMQTIMSTTATELGRIFGLRRAHFRLKTEMQSSESDDFASGNGNKALDGNEGVQNE
jgi:GAF domain-containing protein/HAMP domain-containing protein